MKIYMESLHNYTGEWVDLNSIDKEGLQELENKYSLNGMHDIIIADWEDIPFKIDIYSNWVKIWEKAQLEDIEEGQYQMLELLGYNVLEIDEFDMKQKLEEIYCIECENDEDFAFEYYSQMYDIEQIQEPFKNAINYEKLFRDLEIELTIHKQGNMYYYTY